ncbi:putative transport protein [Scardovia inopinata JCM 12537]|nr:putative transport protein [Scardovia inopinata JCM 12537]
MRQMSDGSKDQRSGDRHNTYRSNHYRSDQDSSDEKSDDRINISDTSAIRRFDLAAIFPSKGDSRRPPEWLGRGLLYAVIAVFLAIFVWNSWSKISSVVFYIIVSLFIALALEPLILRLIRHGWKRSAASLVVLASFVILVVVFLSMFGLLLVQQLTKMIENLPNTYSDIRRNIISWTGYHLPKKLDFGTNLLSFLNKINKNGAQGYISQAYSTVSSFLSGLLAILTILLVTYYICAAGPRMRRSLCKWLPRKSQRKFIVVWTTVQTQISNYLYSRFLLSIISAICMSIFMIVMKIPYWLPLSIFCGLVSQFIPTIGTYLGGLVPIVSAWGTNGWQYAVYLLIYIVVYQQIENLILSPRISKDTMDLNPAIALLSVFFFGDLFGALGAFLALPITASLQALLSAYMRSYDLIDSDLLDDPKPKRKSGLVTGAELLEKNVLQPLSEHIPRTSRGSSANVMVDKVTKLRMRAGELAEEEFEENQSSAYKTSQEEDESATVAIPQAQLAADPERKTQKTQGKEGGRGARGQWES